MILSSHFHFMFQGLWHHAVPQILEIREMQDLSHLLGSSQLLFTIRAGICCIQARSSHIILDLFHFPCFHHHQVPCSVKTCKKIKLGCKMNFRQKCGISWWVLAPDFAGLKSYSWKQNCSLEDFLNQKWQVTIMKAAVWKIKFPSLAIRIS